MANEVLDCGQKWQRRFLLKVGFEKAYDDINWAFFFTTMEKMGVDNLWLIWMRR